MSIRRARSEEGGRVKSIRDFVQRKLQIVMTSRKSRIGRERVPRFLTETVAPNAKL